MEAVKKTSQQALETASKVIRPVLDNKIFLILFGWVIILNSISILNDLPVNVRVLLTHPVFKVLSVFASVYYITNGDIKAALMWTVILIVVYKVLLFAQENFDVITNTPQVYPGCTTATVADLLSLFDGDTATLKKSMYELGVPLNLTLNDSNAPLIATYFINHGEKISKSCRQPE